MAGETLRPPLQVGTGEQAALNVSAPQLIKAGPGRVAKVSVTVAGTAAGTLHDAASVGAAAAGNRIAIVPAEVGVLELDWPFVNGLVFVPGDGQVASICFS